MIRKRIVSILLAVLGFSAAWAEDSPVQAIPAQGTPAQPTRASMVLDRGLRPGSTAEVSSLFENVVAVQRKAKQKAGKFLLAPLLSFDFSDSPFTMYGLNLSLGYAIGEFWEVYLTYTPAFAANERNISKKVKELVLANGDAANIETEKAKSYYGIDVNWVPIYGKDSWGPYGIVRSDTFLNFSAGQMNYEINKGLKYKFALGKTFFFSDNFNFRVQAGPSMLDTFSKGIKQNIIIGLIEAGAVFYF